MTSYEIPIGIRNNNPGNLRQAYGMEFKTVLINGYASFPSLLNGVQSLAMLTYDYYVVHGLRTLPDFVGRYAPATENDVLAYIKNMRDFLHYPVARPDNAPLELSDPWNAILFIRAVIRCECGLKPRGETVSGDWVPPSIMAAAIAAAHRWGPV